MTTSSQRESHDVQHVTVKCINDISSLYKVAYINIRSLVNRRLLEEATRKDIIMCLCLIALMILVYLYPIIRDKYLNRPPSPFYIPVLGNIYPYLMFKEPRHKVFKKMADIYGSIFTFRFFNRKVLILNDVAAVKEAYNKGTDFFYFYSFL